MTALKPIGDSPFRMPPAERLTHMAGLDRPDGLHFLYRCRREDGKWKTKQFYVAPEAGATPRREWDRARAAARSFRGELLATGKPAGPATKTEIATETLRALMRRWLEELRVSGKREATLASYEADLTKHFGKALLELPLDQVTREAVVRAIKAAAFKRPRTHNKNLGLLRAILRTAPGPELRLLAADLKDLRHSGEGRRRQERKTAVDLAVERLDVPAFVTSAEALVDGTSAGRALAVIALTGLRLEEALGLRVADVKLDPEVAPRVEDLRVEGTKTAAAHRFIPLTEEAAAIVSRQLAALGALVLAQRDAFLFPVLYRRARSKARPGDRLSAGVLRRAMRDVAAAMKFELPKNARCVVHFLRHVARSVWIAEGLTDAQADRALGHAAGGVRATYTHGRRRELYLAFRNARRVRELLAAADAGAAVGVAASRLSGVYIHGTIA
jgi:integrase